MNILFCNASYLDGSQSDTCTATFTVLQFYNRSAIQSKQQTTHNFHSNQFIFNFIKLSWSARGKIMYRVASIGSTEMRCSWIWSYSNGLKYEVAFLLWSITYDYIVQLHFHVPCMCHIDQMGCQLSIDYSSLKKPIVYCSIYGHPNTY